MRICTVTVRRGSKGVRGKNWREVAGLPLFAHSLRHAVDSGLFERIVVTSDAPEVLSTAHGFGATDIIERPAELATDTAGKVPAILHAVLEAEAIIGAKFSVVVDLDATSPLRETSDIVGAVELLESRGAESVITGAPAHRSPYFNLVEEDPKSGIVSLSKESNRVLRRQDAPRTFDMNASVYVWNRDSLVANPVVFFPTTLLYEMPPERSLDIDSEFDFRIVSWLLESRKD
ncbi:MAG TPA: acylneuraminate cytidylyltransferase family protein [Terrimesophilobacter sp.]|nr:acylneuraminate cytidylyltransferase family protein [Terrimesophilobacter sp.]